MKNLESLSKADREKLLKYPAYITLLAVNKDEALDEEEKATAIKYSHIKTYTSDPILREFYEEADKVFEKNIDELDAELPRGMHDREEAIKKELESMEPILMKLGKDYAYMMHRSMGLFKEHVSKAHRNVLEYFIFPMPIKGVTD